MKTIAIVQARMSSSRFPGKMLTPLLGVPLAVFVCRRLAACRTVDAVVLATSDHADDTPLATAVEQAGFAVQRGSLTDVLRRVTAAARAHQADRVVRITGDCPLADAALIDRLVERHRQGDAQYVCNVAPPTFPDGLDCEVIAMTALEAADREATEAHDREHVTPFIRQRPERFGCVNLACDLGDLSAWHWSVDRPEHLALVADLLTEAGGAEADLAALVAAAKRDQGLLARSVSERPNAGAIATYRAEMDRRAPPPNIARSNAWWKRAEGLIPAGTQTLSKGPTQWVRGFAPKYLARGKGSHVWDVDGNEFIDYPMGLGPVTLGHGHPAVVEAVARQLADGNAFSLMHPLEVELAERLRDIIPCARGDGMIRFGKNGSDATSACIRAARAKTGRTFVARHGYHGWQDWSIESTYGLRAKGVPAEIMGLTTTFPYHDPEALERILAAKPHAAVIMEPVNITPPRPGYLAACRDIAHRHGAVFIFDEVITGFRYARGGAQEHFGIEPDLCAMGKGVANGLPLAVVAGKREYMQPFDEVFFSFTFGGETTALAAAMATLDVMERENYWAHVWRQGGRLQDGYRSVARDLGLLDSVTDCLGMPPWTAVVFKDTPKWSGLMLKTLFQQEMLRRGVLFSGSQFISLAHSDTDIAWTLNAYREAMRVVRTGIDLNAVDALLMGEINEVIFKRG